MTLDYFIWWDGDWHSERQKLLYTYERQLCDQFSHKPFKNPHITRYSWNSVPHRSWQRWVAVERCGGHHSTRTTHRATGECVVKPWSLIETREPITLWNKRSTDTDHERATLTIATLNAFGCRQDDYHWQRWTKQNLKGNRPTVLTSWGCSILMQRRSLYARPKVAPMPPRA